MTGFSAVARAVARPTVRSERPDGAYDATAEGSLPAAVGKQPEPGKLPRAVLGMIRKDPPGGVARCAAWQVQDEVVILGHYLLLCARRRTAQVVSENFRRFRRCASKASGVGEIDRPTTPGTAKAPNRVAGITAGTGISWLRRVWYLRRGVASERGGRPRRSGTTGHGAVM